MTRHDPRSEPEAAKDEDVERAQPVKPVKIQGKKVTFESANKFQLLVEDSEKEGQADQKESELSEARIGISLSIVGHDPPKSDPNWIRPGRKFGRAQRAQPTNMCRDVGNCGCVVSTCAELDTNQFDNSCEERLGSTDGPPVGEVDEKPGEVQHEEGFSGNSARKRRHGSKVKRNRAARRRAQTQRREDVGEESEQKVETRVDVVEEFGSFRFGMLVKQVAERAGVDTHLPPRAPNAEDKVTGVIV